MDFYERVAVVCREIPAGRVATYGQIALLCGKPQNARQVGYALNHRVTGADIPAHRVVNASGYLSGAAAFDNRAGQRKLLKSEGVSVDSENKVNLRAFGWKNTMDTALWLLAEFESRGI